MNKGVIIAKIAFLAFLLTGCAVPSPYLNGNSSLTQMNYGKNLPPFSLSKTDSLSQRVSNKDLPKHPFILHFWASWAVTSALDQPTMLELQSKHIPVVGVAFKDEVDDANDYLKRQGNPYMFNLHDANGDFGIDMSVTGIPETFVIDGKGRIRFHVIGEVQQNSRQLKQLLKCYDALTIEKNEQKVSEACS